MRRCPSRSTRWRSRAFPRSRCASSSSITASARCSRGSAPSPRPAPRRQPTTQAEVRPEPKIDRSLYETVTDEAALDRWIAEAHRQGPGRVRHRDRRARLRLGQAGRDQPRHRAATRPATSRSSMAATTCSPSGPTSSPPTLVLARLKPLLEDPAVLKIGHNLKFDWVVLDRRGIGVAPYDDTLVMSFNLDAGGLNSHALDDLAKKHLDHDCIAFKDRVRDRAEADHLQQGAARPARPNMPPRMPTWRCGCGCASATRLPFEKVTRVYELVDRPMVAVVGADGARRRQGRPRGAEEPVGRVQRPDRRAGGADLRRGRLQVHHRQPAATGRHLVQPDGPVGRAQGQVRHLVDRRHRARAAVARGRADRPARARLAPAHQAQIDLYRRAAGADQPRHRPRPHQLLAVGRADRPARLDRPQSA